MPNTHSLYFAPSSFSRRIVCPGSAFLEEVAYNKFGRTSSPAADRGTACHHICYEYFTNKKQPKTWLGETLADTVVDQQMVDMCRTAVDTVRKIINQNKEHHQYFEQRVTMEGYGIKGMFGTVDVALDHAFETLWIIDLKFGQFKVSPDSDQLKPYGLMLAESVDVLKSYEKIYLAIVQPARPDADGNCLYVHEMAPGQLLDYFNEVVDPTVVRIEGRDQELHASEDGCRFCAAKTFCPEYSKAALAVAQADFSAELTLPTIGADFVAQNYDKLKLLEAWIKDFKDAALKYAQDGVLPGYKVVHGRGRRAWIDEVAAAEIIKAAGHAPYEQKLLSPAKAEKLKGVKSKIKGLIDKIPGNPQVAPETDKRPAIVASAQSDFNKGEKGNG